MLNILCQLRFESLLSRVLLLENVLALFSSKPECRQLLEWLLKAETIAVIDIKKHDFVVLYFQTLLKRVKDHLCSVISVVG